MGNLRDGGYVVIGIDDAAPQEMLPGLDDEELASWQAYDDVSARLAVYCDPPLRFEMAQFELASSAEVVVLQVHEFSDIPISARVSIRTSCARELYTSGPAGCLRRLKSHRPWRCARFSISRPRSGCARMLRLPSELTSA